MFISLLGSPRLLIDQRPFEGLRRKNRALIFYLAARREALTRDQVLAFFWPDVERPAAQQILRTMLHDLRKHLSENALVIEEDRLSLATEVQVDTRQLDAILAAPDPNAARLASTLDFYRGDFLEGFTLADTPAFDDWAVGQREYYRSQAIRGFSMLGHLYEAEGKMDAALEAVSRALAIDPLREEAQRDGLRLRYLTGDRAGAIRQYEALRKLLDEELGVPPMPETRALYDAIITDKLPSPKTHEPAPRTGRPASAPAELRSVDAASPPAASSPAPLLPFTGRAGELKELNALASSGGLVLVEGAPGIGKTRLVEEFLAALAGTPHRAQMGAASRPSTSLNAAGAAGRPVVLRGVAHELEQGLPYQPVVDALRCLLSLPEWPALRDRLDLAPVWLAEITRLLPELQAQIPGLPEAPQAADESRLWEAVSLLLQRLSGQRPVIVFFDDLHWADASTLGLAGYLARRAASPAILLLATTRPVDPHSRLAVLEKALVHENHLTRLALSPLSAADTRAVARQLSVPHFDLLSGWLSSSAEGNPYFLTELVRYAYHTHALQKDGLIDPSAFTSTQMLPPTIQNLILSRLIRLSEEARRVLDAAAVTGHEFDFELVFQVLSEMGTGYSEEVLLDALDELQAAVLIQPHGSDGFTFDHSLTMEVALQEMGAVRRRLLHRHVAQTLTRLHAQRLDPIAGLVAQHYAKSSAPKQAAPYAYRAGLYAASLAAWVEAIDFYEQALSVEEDAGKRASIMIAMGSARFHKGDFALASDALLNAIGLAREHSDLANLEAAYMGLNLSLLPQSRFTEAIALGRELVDSGSPEMAICAHFIWASGLSVESAHPDEAEAHLREVERLLNEQPGYRGQVTQAHVKYQLAGVIGQQGHSQRAVELYKEALRLVRENDSSLDLLRQIMSYNNLAYHLHLLGDPSAAEYARAGIKLAQERGSLTHIPYLMSTSGEIALSRNELDEAEAFFTEGLRLAEQVQIAERIAGLSANLGLVARRRGQDALARQRLTKALKLADQLGSRHLAVRIRCWLAPLLPPDEARARLQEARSMAEESGFRGLFEEIAQIEQEIQPT